MYAAIMYAAIMYAAIMYAAITYAAPITLADLPGETANSSRVTAVRRESLERRWIHEWLGRSLRPLVSQAQPCQWRASRASPGYCNRTWRRAVSTISDMRPTSGVAELAA
jgi:hypothetical protein